MMYLTDTLSGKLRECTSSSGNTLTMYVCGVTPYDNAHLGHGRCYVVFDILFRLLKKSGYNVHYCRNITDVEDKLIKKSMMLHGTGSRFLEVANFFYQAFVEDMTQLNCLPPSIEPRVTESMPKIITFIEQLIEKGNAYVVNGDVYFSIDTYQKYGELAHRTLNEQKAGARVAVNEEKKNSLDFALWKSADSEPSWKSPWGMGRPGWHIECSVMAQECCGKTVDIHGGGMDLIFPHHENERAQSETHNGCLFAHMWVHCAFIRIDQEKMSKSLNNFVTLRDVFEKHHPMVLRYFYLSHHHRSPLDFSWNALEVAQKGYKKLVRLFENYEKIELTELTENARIIYKEAFDHLLNDMNIPGFIGVLFAYSDIIRQDKYLSYVLRQIIKEVLGLELYDIKNKESDDYNEEIKLLIHQREEARKNKEWKRADELRDILQKMGINIQDKK